MGRVPDEAARIGDIVPQDKGLWLPCHEAEKTTIRAELPSCLSAAI
jgi:hypothetical protein